MARSRGTARFLATNLKSSLVRMPEGSEQVVGNHTSNCPTSLEIEKLELSMRRFRVSEPAVEISCRLMFFRPCNQRVDVIG